MWCRASALRAATAYVAISVATATGVAAQASHERFTIRQALSAPFPTELIAAPTGDAVAWTFDAQGANNVWVATAPTYTARPITRFVGDSGIEIGPIRWRPDGRAVVFVRGSGPNDRGENPNPTLNPRGTHQVIMTVGIDGTELRQLAEGAAPRVSPDGRRVAFIRRGEAWSVGLTDSTAAARLFVARGTIGNLRWSPNGAALAFVSERGDHSFVGVYDVRAKTITYLDPSVDTDRYPVWSPDGRRIAFIRQPARTRQAVHAIRRSGVPWSIRLADVHTGKGTELWRAHAGVGSVFYELESDDQLAWTADDQVVFPWEGTGWAQLYSIAVRGGSPLPLTAGSFEVRQAVLAHDGRTMLYVANAGDIDRQHVWSVSASGGTPVRRTPGNGIEWSPVSLADHAVALLRSDAQRPARPALLRDGTVTDLAPGAIPADFPRAAMVRPVQVTFPASDGLTIHGQLFLPPHDSVQRHPAVVFFHGGSRRQMLLGWNMMGYYHNAYALNQYLASRGYVVLSVNYRSGTGYGLNFREALGYGPAGATEFRDVLGAAHYLRSRADVNAARMGVWGGSYGGYMTALSLSRDPADFRVGVDFAGVHDWNLEWSRWVDTWDEAREMAARRLAYASSPMGDLSGWRAPVLLIQGDDDRNVAFAQTVQLTEDLRARGVHVETLIFPDETHEFLLHEHWVRSYEATAEFLERYLSGPQPSPGR